MLIVNLKKAKQGGAINVHLLAIFLQNEMEFPGFDSANCLITILSEKITERFLAIKENHVLLSGQSEHRAQHCHRERSNS